jgi:microcystin-dependent protein
MTVYLSNRDGLGKTNEEGHYRLLSKMTEGQAMTSTDVKVTENSPLGLSVLVQPGDYKIDTSGGYAYMGWIAGTETVAITTPDPSNPRITSIVLYVDKLAVTSAAPPNNPGIAKLMAINGAAAGTPTAPSGATIQSAVGSGNPYIILATVLVGAGVTQVTNSNITDLRTRIKLTNAILENSALAQYVGPLLFPVGSIYTNAVNGTNPATLLGFGTWTEFAQGRVPVGINPGEGEFDTPLETGGTKTESLSTNQIPAHGHVVDPPATWSTSNGYHSHNVPWRFIRDVGGNSGNLRQTAGGAPMPWQNLSSVPIDGAGDHGHIVDIAPFWSQNTGSGASHNNLQPYIVVYMWRRTA